MLAIPNVMMVALRCEHGGKGYQQRASNDPQVKSAIVSGINPGSKVDFKVAGKDGRAFLRRVGRRAVKPSRFERMRGTATSGLTTDEIMALTRDRAG